LPGDHEILLTSTAFTMKKGQSYFTDYELFFLNYTFAISDRTHLGLFTLFPITSDFIKSFTIGVKQNIIQIDNFAASLSGAFIPETSNFYLGGTMTLGSIRNNLNLSIGSFSESSEFLLSLGAQVTMNETTSFLVEYISTDSGISNDVSNGLFTIGIRLRSEAMAWEIGGFRSLNNGGGDSDLILFPILKATIVF
jgi:hypothetical protein